MKFRLLFIGLLASSQPVFSAPFCVLKNYAKECWYYDANECKRKAYEQNGMCVVNEEEKNSSGGDRVDSPPRNDSPAIKSPDFQKTMENANSTQEYLEKNRRLYQERRKDEAEYYNTLDANQKQEYLRQKKVDEEKRESESRTTLTIIFGILGVAAVGLLVLISNS